MVYEIHISDEALKLLSENGYDPVYGARPLKRAIQQQIENPLAQQILSGEWFRVKLFARKLMKTGSSPSSNDKTSLRGSFFLYRRKRLY